MAVVLLGGLVTTALVTLFVAARPVPALSSGPGARHARSRRGRPAQRPRRGRTQPTRGRRPATTAGSVDHGPAEAGEVSRVGLGSRSRWPRRRPRCSSGCKEAEASRGRAVPARRTSRRSTGSDAAPGARSPRSGPQPVGPGRREVGAQAAAARSSPYAALIYDGKGDRGSTRSSSRATFRRARSSSTASKATRCCSPTGSSRRPSRDRRGGRGLRRRARHRRRALRWRRRRLMRHIVGRSLRFRWLVVFARPSHSWPWASPRSRTPRSTSSPSSRRRRSRSRPSPSATPPTRSRS